MSWKKPWFRILTELGRVMGNSFLKTLDNLPGTVLVFENIDKKENHKPFKDALYNKRDTQHE